MYLTSRGKSYDAVTIANAVKLKMHKYVGELLPESSVTSLSSMYKSLVCSLNYLKESYVALSLSSPSFFRASRRSSSFSARGQISTLMPCDRGSF